MTSTNIHNTLPSRFILGGINHVRTNIREDNVQVKVARLCECTNAGQTQFAIGVVLACEASGYMTATDTQEMLDYLCAML